MFNNDDGDDDNENDDDVASLSKNCFRGNDALSFTITPLINWKKQMFTFMDNHSYVGLLTKMIRNLKKMLRNNMLVLIFIKNQSALTSFRRWNYHSE